MEEKINIIPIQTRVVIEPEPAETKTKSGLYIPDTAKEKPRRGTIVAIGPGSKDEVMVVEVGQRVIYREHAGVELEDEETMKEYILLWQSDILAIIPHNENINIIFDKK